MSGSRQKPLAGVRILDLSNVLAGPMGTYILGMLGAEVIKIERPGSGDLSRKMGAKPALSRKAMGASYLAINAQKKSLSLNLQTEKGREIFLKLVPGADIVFENFRPGTMERLGLGYDVLSRIKPNLVYCAVSGFGQDGPLSKRPAYDQIIQGYSGLMSLTGSAETAPTRVGIVVCDAASAISAGLATVAALFRAKQTGEGAMIDVSMLETTLHMSAWVVSNYYNANFFPKPMGNQNISAAPSGTYPAKDGNMTVVCNEEKQFLAFCDAIGRSDLKIHPVFSDRDERVRNRDALNAIIEPILREKTVAEWEEIFGRQNVPVGPVYSIPQILEHPQIQERGFIKSFDDVPGADGPAKVVGLGFRFQGEDLAPHNPPPTLGQHNQELLADVGIGADEMAELKRAGVI